MFESAKALGFSDEAYARDLCQLQFLAQLMPRARVASS